jgi:hypothetical protein
LILYLHVYDFWRVKIFNDFFSFFSDEISIACNPDNLGILYVSNPDPDQLIYVVSFSELTKQKCNSEFLEGRRFVAVGGCSLVSCLTHYPAELLK